jgi:hypothetical protein
MRPRRQRSQPARYRTCLHDVREHVTHRTAVRTARRRLSDARRRWCTGVQGSANTKAPSSARQQRFLCAGSVVTIPVQPSSQLHTVPVPVFQQLPYTQGPLPPLWTQVLHGVKHGSSTGSWQWLQSSLPQLADRRRMPAPQRLLQVPHSEYCTRTKGA